MASESLSVPHCRLGSAPYPLGPRLLTRLVGPGRPRRVVWSRDSLTCVLLTGPVHTGHSAGPHFDSYQGHPVGVGRHTGPALGPAGWDVPDGGLSPTPGSWCKPHNRGPLKCVLDTCASSRHWGPSQGPALFPGRPPSSRGPGGALLLPAVTSLPASLVPTRSACKDPAWS